MKENQLVCIHVALHVPMSVCYLTGLQGSDALPETVGHSLWDHSIKQGIPPFFLLIQLLDELHQLGILLLLL